jgi:hypothetical protein
VLGKVIGRQRAAETRRTQTFAELVRQIAYGDEPDAEAVEESLQASGKSADDLSHEVYRLATRIAQSEDVASASKLTAELAKVTSAHSAAEVKLSAAIAAAEKEFSAVAAPLAAKSAELEGGLAKAEFARNELRATASADRVAVRDEVQGRFNKLQGERRRLNDDLDDTPHALKVGELIKQLAAARGRLVKAQALPVISGKAGFFSDPTSKAQVKIENAQLVREKEKAIADAERSIADTEAAITKAKSRIAELDATVLPAVRVELATAEAELLKP